MAMRDGKMRVVAAASPERTAAEIAAQAGLTETYARRILTDLDLPWQRREERPPKHPENTDQSWWGSRHPYTGRVMRGPDGEIIARQMNSGWWRVQMWHGAPVAFARTALRARSLINAMGRA